MTNEEREYRREIAKGYGPRAQRKDRTVAHSRRARRDSDRDLQRRFNGGEHDVSDAE